MDGSSAAFLPLREQRVEEAAALQERVVRVSGYSYQRRGKVIRVRSYLQRRNLDSLTSLLRGLKGGERVKLPEGLEVARSRAAGPERGGGGDYLVSARPGQSLNPDHPGRHSARSAAKVTLERSAASSDRRSLGGGRSTTLQRAEVDAAETARRLRGAKEATERRTRSEKRSLKAQRAASRRAGGRPGDPAPELLDLSPTRTVSARDRRERDRRREENARKAGVKPPRLARENVQVKGHKGGRHAFQVGTTDPQFTGSRRRQRELKRKKRGKKRVSLG